jgi:uncharacterized protein with FMN-binding domain
MLVRRALFAFVGTALGTGLMVGAKLGTRPQDLGADLTQSETVAGAEPAAPGDSSPAPLPSAATATPTAAGPTGAPPTTTRAPAPTTAPPPPPAGGGLKNGTFAGPSVTQRYGTIKVSIVVTGGRITDVTASYPTGGDTGEINARAIPRLRQSALSAQSANISTVSGATYTSNAYKQSLQGAINAAKA